MSGDHNMNCSANQALDKMAENARALGLDYEPAQQQEPVGYTSQSWLSQSTGGQFSKRKGICGDVPLYTSPQSKPWVGLTEDERLALAAHENFGSVTDYAKAIEAKLRKKNSGGK